MEGTEWGTGETEDKMKVGMGGKEGNGSRGGKVAHHFSSSCRICSCV